MKSLILPDYIKQQIRKISEKDIESCGFVIGSQYKATEVIEIKNVSETPVHVYQMDRTEYIQAVKKYGWFNGEKNSIIARWHSHLVSLEMPSSLDRKYMGKIVIDIIYCISRNSFNAFTKEGNVVNSVNLVSEIAPSHPIKE